MLDTGTIILSRRSKVHGSVFLFFFIKIPPSALLWIVVNGGRFSYRGKCKFCVALSYVVIGRNHTSCLVRLHVGEREIEKG